MHQGFGHDSVWRALTASLTEGGLILEGASWLGNLGQSRASEYIARQNPWLEESERSS